MTSIEWLIKQIDLHYNGENDLYYTEFVEQAKEMHKKEIIHFANDFWNWSKGGDFDISDAEQYYQETYNNKQ
jgi:hypothetical protein